MPIVPIPHLFVVLAEGDSAKLEAALSSQFPNSYFPAFSGQWLLVTGGVTPMEISDRLGITTGEVGGAIVIASTGGYFGRANPQVWEWLTSRLGVMASV